MGNECVVIEVKPKFVILYLEEYFSQITISVIAEDEEDIKRYIKLNSNIIWLKDAGINRRRYQYGRENCNNSK